MTLFAHQPIVLAVAPGDPVAGRWLNRHRAEFESYGITIRTSALVERGFGLLTGLSIPALIVFSDEDSDEPMRMLTYDGDTAEAQR